jgi:hypothetical protein
VQQEADYEGCHPDQPEEKGNGRSSGSEPEPEKVSDFRGTWTCYYQKQREPERKSPLRKSRLSTRGA